MSTINRIFKDGENVVHPETGSDVVLMGNGTTLEATIAAMSGSSDSPILECRYIASGNIYSAIEALNADRGIYILYLGEVTGAPVNVSWSNAIYLVPEERAESTMSTLIVFAHQNIYTVRRNMQAGTWATNWSQLTGELVPVASE